MYDTVGYFDSKRSKNKRMGVLIIHICGLEANYYPVSADLLCFATGTITVAPKLSNTHPNPN